MSTRKPSYTQNSTNYYVTFEVAHFSPHMVTMEFVPPSSSASGGVPEFPVQFGFTLLATVAIVISYLFARRVIIPRV